MTTSTNTDPGTVLITGPSGSLGAATTLAMAERPADTRPDLILVGRLGERMSRVAAQARATGATVHVIDTDLSRLADVRAASDEAKRLVDEGAVRPLRAIIANAGMTAADTRAASADGYELTFAVNHLAHAQLIGDLIGSMATPGRIVLLGSNTYHQNLPRKLLGVPPARWRDPIELAMPAPADQKPSAQTSGVAYSNAKLAILYYAHELQRRAPQGIGVVVYEPGFMPGTTLSREQPPAVQRIGRALARVPGVSTPKVSGPGLASLALDARWAHLRGGAFVVKDEEREVKSFAVDRAREAHLWEATRELLDRA
ncbi:SDR family NAD(P)-dependent oxidoreductase [Tersicoccus sp. Bi-70]|uniref:SDR family NAD(P)-dependent oxidoreductase n=1 Tax=Tersicoccus sp. Bi-70 TaxID=1897634 RepID=UPI000977B1B3|nr:SDR family NAD(P)-dependent oxidoreductase [Tersicoccus sp. Bi-70]OMH36951.1 short-chain dehydrogenase [Tersicoccus sp. Bi-70]